VTARNRRLLAYVLTALLVVALGGAAALLLLGRDASSAVASTQESAARHEVQRVASAFAANVNTYSSQNIDSYEKRVRPLLTDGFEQSFSRAIKGLVAQMRTAGLESRGEVLVTGVSSIDRDSATVLVVADADVQTTAGPRARHFRWRVDLARQDGRWLVNDFEPL
jgi:Mce-associated membrane protein